MNKREFPFGNVQLDGKKKKKSRWNKQEQDKTFIPGMPTVIPPSLSKEQEEQYLIHLQVEEISRRLRSGDLGIPPNPEDRSPSPEPIYNNEGKRLNTREYRTRKRLEEERHNLVQKAFELNADYKPPSDYKPPVIRVSDKVMIPQEDHPDINFVGLLIGPRGNTLKNLEKETGAKIIIRGKGSVKEGKVGRKDGQPLPGEDEPLHAYVTANNPEHVKKAVERVKQIIKEGIEVPEGQNDLRRQQLRELALLNGTLRENDGLAKLKQLAQAQTIVTNTIICTKCGGTGHIAQDCKLPKPGDTLRQFDLQTHTADKAKMDSEYMSLMAELGEGPPPPKQNEPPRMQQPGGRFNQPPPMSGPGWRHGPPPGVQPPGMPGINMQQPPPMIRTSQPPPVVMSQPQTLSSNHHQPPQQALPPPGMVSQPLSLGSAPTAVVAPPTLVTQPTLATPPAPPVGTVVSQPPPSFSQQQGQVQTVVSQVSQPPPMVAPPAPIVSSAPLAPPPWSTSQPGQMSAPVPPHSSSSCPGGVAPPPMMAPPPPPPVSQPTSLPWQPQQQPDCHWSTGMNMGMPPAGAPWQQPGGMVPPPPPSNLPPWQTPPPPGGQPGGIPPGPPPPPPGQHLGMAAPPPPPPVGRPSVGMPSGIPLGVPPPPPPN